MITLVHRFSGIFFVRDNGDESSEAVPRNEEESRSGHKSPDTPCQACDTNQEASVRNSRPGVILACNGISD